MLSPKVKKIKQPTFKPIQKTNPAEPVQIRPLRKFMQLAPWIMLAFLPLVAWPTNPLKIPGQVMFYTGFIAAGLALAAFNILMGKLYSTFNCLNQRGILSKLREDGTSYLEADFQAEYKKFLYELGWALNHKNQWIMAVFFMVLVLTWYLYGRPISSFATKPILIVGVLVEILISFMIGFMAWRMVVVSFKVWKLPSHFSLNLNINHPDQCGGMEPLGNLCLWNALIISCAGVYLGGWIAIGPNTAFRDEALVYTPIFRGLLLIPVSLAIISFILPLWNTHRVMVEKKKEIQFQLDDLVRKIYKEERELLELADRLTPDEVEKRIQKIETKRKIYVQNQKIPTWPISLSIFGKFIASQIVPVFSLVGIAEPIIKLFGNIRQIITGLGS